MITKCINLEITFSFLVLQEIPRIATKFCNLQARGKKCRTCILKIFAENCIQNSKIFFEFLDICIIMI